MNFAPRDWTDKAAWNDYFKAELQSGCVQDGDSYFAEMALRDLHVTLEKGTRIWIPGCGLDASPKKYARRGCHVLATDFATVAVAYQQKDALAILREAETGKLQGSLRVMEQDFTQSKPEGEFDVVFNIRAFQGLSPDRMSAAALHFYAALRPGGVCAVLTINVADSEWRNLMEDSLVSAGFVLSGLSLARWYRRQLADGKNRDWLRAEHERRFMEEQEGIALPQNPAEKVASVIYGSG